MLISEKEFREKYGEIFDSELKKAQFYVNNPDALYKEIEGNRLNSSKLINPYPHPFNYPMTKYKGYARFPERLKNIVIAKNEPRGETRSYLPSILDIEPNSTCNFKCIMCIMQEWEGGKRADDMTLDQLREFIDKNVQIEEVKLHGIGEPLMNPQYIDMVKELVSRDIWVRTSINGSLLHKKDNYMHLADSGIGEILCSVDGASKEVYESIRVNSDFSLVVDNFTKLNKYANGKDKLLTRMWAVIQQNNVHEMEQMVELAARMEFKRMNFSLTINDWGRDDWAESSHELTADLVHDDRLEALVDRGAELGVEVTIWRQADKYKLESADKMCPWVFDRPYISCDMKVVPCCMIADPEIKSFGNAYDFKDIWNNDEYINFRRAHLSGNVPDCCKNCYGGNR